MGKQEKQKKKENVKQPNQSQPDKPPSDPLEKKSSTVWFDELTDEQKEEEIEKIKKREEKAAKEHKKAKELADKKAEEAKEKKKEELQWKDVERQGSKKAENNKYLLKTVEWGEGSWWAEHPKEGWIEAKADYYCWPCDKHIFNANVPAHLESELHKKKVWNHENEKIMAFVPPGLEAAVSSTSQPVGHIPLFSDVIVSKINEWDEQYYFCLACEKVADEFHLNSEKHETRVQSFREANKPREQPDEEWLMWVPWSNEQPESQAELQMRCLLCEKFCNDEESHGTYLHLKLSQLHRKRLLEYNQYYREPVLRERLRYNSLYPMVKQISDSRTLPMLPWSENFAAKAAQLRTGAASNPNAAGQQSVAAVPQQGAVNPWTAGIQSAAVLPQHTAGNPWNGQARAPVPENPPPPPAAGDPWTNGIIGHIAPVQLPRNVPVVDEDGFTMVVAGGQRGANPPAGEEQNMAVCFAMKSYDGMEKTVDGVIEGGYLSFEVGDRLERRSEAQNGEAHNRFPMYSYFINDLKEEGWAPDCHF